MRMTGCRLSCCLLLCGRPHLPLTRPVALVAQALRGRPRIRTLCIASDAGEKHHAGTPLRRAIAKAADTFVDVSLLSDAEAARLINELQPHVLINLVGHTAGSRHQLTQMKAAPVQVMHYGYPGTTALPAMDYMQLDAVAAPPSHARDFTERLAYLPFSHFVAAHTARYPDVPQTTRHAQPWVRDGRRVAASDGADAGREDLGLELPKGRLNGFALINFNQVGCQV